MDGDPGEEWRLTSKERIIYLVPTLAYWCLGTLSTVMHLLGVELAITFSVVYR